MDLSPIIQTLAKTESGLVLVLLLVVAFLCRLLVLIRKEDREDRAKQEARAIEVQTRNNLVLDKVADAITEMRITLAQKGITK